MGLRVQSSGLIRLEGGCVEGGCGVCDFKVSGSRLELPKP